MFPTTRPTPSAFTSRLAAGSRALLSMLCLAALAACGGGGGESLSSTNGNTTTVKVFGDSLADSGTFGGLKFTVNTFAPDASTGKIASTTAIWPELVAGNYGLTLCPFFQATGPTNFTAPRTGCSNYAVGGGRINNPPSNGGATAPYSIAYQMAAAGSFSAGDLVLIDGGGNDMADLISAFLSAALGNTQPFVQLTTTLLPATTVNTVLPTPDGAAKLGGAYAQALADKMAAEIITQLLDKGAQRVALLNLLNISHTPRMQTVLAAIAQRSGNAAAPAQLATLFQQWTQAYNAQLQARLGTNPKVAIVDFYGEFEAQMANPAKYGFTDSKNPACPAAGTDAQGLPQYDFTTCTASALDASTPNWKTYSFSDSFHPTPANHALLARLVNQTLTQKGWLR